MKKAFAAVLVMMTLFAVPALAADGFPTDLAGFVLGTDITRYAEQCELDKAIPVSDSPFLTEAAIVVDGLPGVRGGSLAYGNCSGIEKLVRIKLKFYQMDQELFDQLHAKYLSAYGKPDRYLGDAFKNVIAWEWLFRKDGDEISLILMWSRDKDLRPGVSIKMTHNTLMDSEYECYKASTDPDKQNRKRTRIRSLDAYVPR